MKTWKQASHDDTIIVTHDEKEHIAEVAKPTNARLIAAAPTLLQAAKQIIATASDDGCTDDLSVVSADAVKLLQAAIRKAEGK